MKRIYLLLCTALLATALWAQGTPLARIYTDKDCYLTGENLWIKVSIDDAAYPGNALSRVAYVEVSDTKQIHAQGKVSLTDGKGWACIRMPQTMHSGLYRLAVYTHYMRNLDPTCFPTKHIAVLNAHNVMTDDAIVEATPSTDISTTPSASATNKIVYGKREKVTLRGEGLWDGLKEATLSVVRKDVEAELPQEAAPQPLHQGKDGRFVVEFEGHIVKGKLTTPLPKGAHAYLACVGKTVHLFEGTIQSDSTCLFFTKEVKNQRDMVLSLSNHHQESGSIEWVSPFVSVLPDTLPPLRYSCNEEALVERSIAAQLNPLVLPVNEESQTLSHQLFGTTPARTYNINEYAVLPTLQDALTEYVIGARTVKQNGVKCIQLMREGESQFSMFKALVLLDGVPVENHEAILKYRPRLIHYLHQYEGRYTFGGETHDGVLSLITHKGTFPDMHIDEGAQMFSYEFPQERPEFFMPKYDTETQKHSRIPDFRHTLYWQPEVKANAEEYVFYTSDMPGTYIVTLQGIDVEGKPVERSCSFKVE